MKYPTQPIFLGDTSGEEDGKQTKPEMETTNLHLVNALMLDQHIAVIPKDKEKVLNMFDRFADAYDQGNAHSAMKLSDELWKLGEKRLIFSLSHYQLGKYYLLRAKLLMDNNRWNEIPLTLRLIAPYIDELEKIDSHFVYDIVRHQIRYLLHEGRYHKVVKFVDDLLAQKLEMPDDDLLENLLFAKASSLYSLQEYTQTISAINNIFSSVGADIFDNKELLNKILLLKGKTLYELKEFEASKDIFWDLADEEPDNQEIYEYLANKLPTGEYDTIKKYNKIK